MTIRRWYTPRGITFEGIQSGDGRVIAAGAIEFADFPLPLAWLVEGDQHVFSSSAPVIGNIDMGERRDAGAIYAEGVIDDEDDEDSPGFRVMEMMDAGTAPFGTEFGVSIDGDDWEVEIVATEANDDEEEIIIVASGSGPLSWGTLRSAVASSLVAAAGDADPGEGGGEDGETLFEAAADDIIERATRLRIRGATLCAVPAYDGASIALRPAGEGEETATEEPAVAAALAIPTAPPAEWFTMPYPEQGDERLVQQIDGSWAVPLTITDDGQVYGHLARKDQGHRGYARHVPPPVSSTDYREFHTGYVVCADGTELPVGPLVVGADHAPLDMTLGRARDHYANAALGWADVRCTDGPFGPFVAGALRPSVTEADLRVLRALSLSGDWRELQGHGLELISALSVNVPGFPVAREAVAASAYALVASAAAAAGVHVSDGRVTALVAAGIVSRCSECGERARVASAQADLADAIYSLARTVDRIDRRTRHMEPQAEEAIVARVRPVLPNGTEPR